MTRKLNTTLIALLACAACLAAAVLAGAPVGDALSAAAEVEADGAGYPADHPIDRAGSAFRGGLALPYFSFARGARRIGG